MAAIPALVSFSPSTLIKSADVNANFTAIRDAFNGTAVLTDTPTTIAVTHTFAAAQTFSAGFTAAGATTFAPGSGVVPLTITPTAAVGLKLNQADGQQGIQIAQPTFASTSGEAAIQVTGGTAGGASAPAILSLAQTWNTTGQPVAVFVSVTAAAFANGSSLLKLIANGLTAVNAYFPTANSTQFNLDVGLNQAADSTLRLTANAGQNRQFNFLTAGTNRWGLWANNSAESGSDAGSGFQIRAYSDSGALIDSVLTITRAAGGTALWVRPMQLTPSSGTALSISPNGVGINIGQAGGVAFQIQQFSGTTNHAIQVSGGSVTGANNPSLLNLFQTWNNASASPTAILVSITNTSSAATSKLLDLQVGGSSVFSVSPSSVVTITDSKGNVVAANGGATGGQLQVNHANTVVGLEIIGSGGSLSDIWAHGGTYTGAGSVGTALYLQQTWNSGAQVLTAIRLEITNTASAAGSNLLDLLVGGTSKFSVDVNGAVHTSSSNEGTGASTPALGSNFPGTVTTAPYKWLRFIVSDGTTVYVPAWR